MPQTRVKAILWHLVTIATLSAASLSMTTNASSSASGIEGSVKVGPISGGPARQGVPDTAPMAKTTFVVETEAGILTTFKTDDQGNFKVEVPPGRYAIRIEKPPMKGRGCSLTEIDVTAGDFKKVHLVCDTGIR